MIIRLTKRVQYRIKLKLSGSSPSTDQTVFLEEWYVNQFILEHVPFLIFTEAKSLFSIVKRSKGITKPQDLEHLSRDVLFECFKQNSSLDISLFENLAGEVIFSKTENRSILGSQNDLIHMIEWHPEGIDQNLNRVNETPLKFIGYNSPDREFNKLLILNKK